MEPEAGKPGERREEELDTARLVARFQAGDKEAFTALYRRYFDRVHSYLKIALKDPHEAEDATQEVFVKLLESLGRYEQRGRPFRAWLFTVVRNTALMALRKDERVQVTDPSEIARHQEQAGLTEPELEVLEWITDVDLLTFIERLPLPQRQVLVLRFMLGLPAREIAPILGRTPNDVSAIQSRAVHFLRDRLKSLGRTGSSTDQAPTQRRNLQAPVLRNRRYALVKK